MKSLLGPYNQLLDEVGHLLISVLIIAPFATLLSPLQIIICITAGILIDIDHVFNTFICKKIIKVPNYKGSLIDGDQGYSPNIFHGLDVAILVGCLISIQFSLYFGFAIAAVLIGHLFWDFIIYPNKLSWIFLTTRAFKKFNVGKRSWFVGRIFSDDTLKY